MAANKKRARALELDDTSVRSKQKRDDPVEDLYEPDIPPSPAGPTPAARPVMLELTGERLSFVTFVMEMRKALPTEDSCRRFFKHLSATASAPASWRRSPRRKL